MNLPLAVLTSIAITAGPARVAAQDHAKSQEHSKPQEKATSQEHAKPAQDLAKPPQEPAKTPQAAHGIVRKAQPRQAGRAESIKVAPAASTEAVAAAIAAAVRSVEEAKKPLPKPRLAAPSSARAHSVSRRRYVVQWPDRRVVVRWEAAGDRVELTWPGTDAVADDDSPERTALEP